MIIHIKPTHIDPRVASSRNKNHTIHKDPKNIATNLEP